jgi:hypothetical protein
VAHDDAFIPAISERGLGLFEDRYGAGSFTQLIAMLQQPCVSFAQIASRFGVSRERVRQWQLRFLPDAPRGHQRQRLCLIQHEKRKLLADPLFRGFYRHARPHFDSGDFVLIRARDGFRKRAVRLHGRLIVIKTASPASGRTAQAVPAYTLTSPAMPADFVYYRLNDAEYLVVPHHQVPRGATTFLDTDSSSYRPYRNTFAAVRDLPLRLPETTEFPAHEATGVTCVAQ